MHLVCLVIFSSFAHSFLECPRKQKQKIIKNKNKLGNRTTFPEFSVALKIKMEKNVDSKTYINFKI